MSRARTLAAATLALALPACGLFPTGSDGGTSPSSVSDAATSHGFGTPTLQVTVNGVHFGPGAPDTGSGASYVNQRNAGGAVFSSTFKLIATSQAAQAACSIDVQRVGDGVTPIGAGAGYVIGSNALITPDGEVDPGAGEGVQIPQGTWQCSGAACNGGSFVLTVFDATHVEGYLSGSLQNYVAGTLADVVCAFNVPLTTYSP